MAFWAWAQKPYFQQRVDYQIKVLLVPEKALLRGQLRLVYENRSPDTLYGLYMHLWPNAYRSRHTAYARQERRGGSTKFHFARPAEQGWIDSLDFRIDGTPVKPLPAKAGPPPAPGYSPALLRRATDVVWLPFPQPLPPNQRVTIETPFRVKVPKTFSRMGHEGPQFQITQWYPKPAVYDPKGWHPLPYLDLGEFYSEWGRYEVEITVPATYVVGATGILQNAEELAWLRQREATTREWLAARRGGQPDWDTSLSAPPKTLRFVQDSVHDFAWFADPRYAVLADTVTLENGHRVACVALFRPAYAQIWKEAPRYIAEAVRNLSKWVGPYPYAHATAVEGALSAGGGMEYPMITVISTSDDSGTLQTVIHHEVGHNWFQGLLGSNERLNAWQDEGIISYYEERLGRTAYEESTQVQAKYSLDIGGVKLPVLKDYSTSLTPNPLFYALHHWNLDQPFTQSSEFFSTLNYGLGVYQRTAALLRAFSECVGRSAWDAGMQHYFSRWAFRHPYPEDWAAALEEKGLPALAFLRVLNGHREPDFRLRVRRLSAHTVVVSIDEPQSLWQGLCLPLYVLGRRDSIRLEYAVKVGTSDTLNLPADARLILLHPTQVPFERRTGNNLYYLKGLFHQLPGLAGYFGPYKLLPIHRFGLGLTPLWGYNYRDGLLFGLLINHGLFPKRLVEFHALPMYSVLRSQARGSAGLTLRAFPNSPWYLVELRLRASSFAGLVRTKAALEWHRRAPWDRLGWAHTLRLRTYQLGFIPLDGWNVRWENGGRPVYLALDWEGRREEGILTVYSLLSIGHDLRGHVRAEGEWRFYWRLLRRWGPWARLYGGYAADGAADYLLLRPAGFDPFGEKILLDRFRESDRFVSRQMPETQGGWRAPSDALVTQALLAMNLEIPIPSFSMLRLRLDAGYLPLEARSYYGLSVGLPVIRWRDRLVAGLYFPIWGDALGAGRLPQGLGDSIRRASWHIEFPLDLRGAPVGLF